jgi:RIO kinase 1
MKVPERIEPLIEEGLVDSVLRQLMSGKEATVFVVQCGEEIRCAKIYKEANKRSFRQAVVYTEGRKVKNSRRARAMDKGSRFGRKAREESWQSTEADALHRLAAAGVRVPKPYHFYAGVLLMDLVTDADGNAALRLNDMSFTAEEARTLYHALMMEVVRMLCVGIIHGDLSEYNILLGAEGPVIIDLPQAVNAAGNNQAASLLERDVANLTNYFGQFAPDLLDTDYGKEIWALYKAGALHPNVVLTGCYEHDSTQVDLNSVVREIDDARADDAARRLRLLQRA